MNSPQLAEVRFRPVDVDPVGHRLPREERKSCPDQKSIEPDQRGMSEGKPSILTLSVNSALNDDDDDDAVGQLSSRRRRRRRQQRRQRRLDGYENEQLATSNTNISISSRCIGEIDLFLF